MATIRIPYLVSKTNKGGRTTWHWQPSAALAKAGWTPVALGADEAAAVDAARARNLEVERWRAGGARPREVRAIVKAATLAALIARYKSERLWNPKTSAADNNRQRRVAASTSKTYRTALARLEAWAGAQPLAFITPARVRALRDAMMADDADGGIGHDPAHKTLKMLRTLCAFAIRCDLMVTNPAKDFDLSTPPPRTIVISPPAREALVAAADARAMPSMALAIMLGFAIGQREADLIQMGQRQYVALSEHSVQPEDFAMLAALAPDGVPRGIRLRQNKTNVWVEVPVVGEVRVRLEANIDRARAGLATTILFDDTRPDGNRAGLYAGDAGQTRFQRDFADVRDAAIAAATKVGDPLLAGELATVQFRDLRRTCVVYLGELGLDAHLIVAITGHDIDETQRILKTYMPRTTGRAAHAIVLSHARDAKADAARAKASA